MFGSSLLQVVYRRAPANRKLIDIRGNLLKELQKSQPNYESARELIGQFFHIMQMFYSNTNFINKEMSHFLVRIAVCVAHFIKVYVLSYYVSLRSEFRVVMSVKMFA
jgi:hypothetical protein